MYLIDIVSVCIGGVKYIAIEPPEKSSFPNDNVRIFFSPSSSSSSWKKTS